MANRAPLQLDVSYRQIVVIQRDALFNDWTSGHVAQWFAWRSGSASFMTLDDGTHDVWVEQVEHAGDLHGDTVRAIEVPFEIAVDDEVEVASITESFPISLSPGRYSLRCEFLNPSEDHRERVRLVFIRSDAPAFRILKADAELNPPTPLVTYAEPA